MRTSFFAPAAPTAETLKKDVRLLADDTLKIARQQVVDPAIEVARRARSYARDAVNENLERVSKQLTQAERYASAQYNETSRWVLMHPFKSVGIALAVGIAITRLFSSPRR